MLEEGTRYAKVSKHHLDSLFSLTWTFSQHLPKPTGNWRAGSSVAPRGTVEFGGFY